MSTTSSFFFVVFVLLSRTLKISLACTDILLTSDYLGKRHFTALSANESLTAGLVSGHAAYSTRNAEHDHDMPLPVLYLYHIVLQQDGRGRWVINSALGKEDSAIMFMDSWAVMPTLTHALSSTHEKFWQQYVLEESKWMDDPRTFFRCQEASVSQTAGAGVDDTLYLDILGSGACQHSGFFVRHADSISYGTGTETETETRTGTGLTTPVYSHIGVAGEPNKFLFKQGASWVLGAEPGEALGKLDTYITVSRLAYLFFSFSHKICLGSWHAYSGQF